MPLLNTDYISQISNKGIIQLNGEERVKYLQGQVTADISKLDEDHALLACHCDFKGKMWSVFYTLNWQDSILLIPHVSTLEKSLAELNKYGVFAKVEITDQTNNWNITAGAGSQIENAITTLFGGLPTNNNAVIANEYGMVLSITQPHQRYLVLQPKTASKILNIVATDAADLWERDDIISGLADVRSLTSNEFVPQMLNLQILNAIDFEKGCYMGQEVVARTKYLGRNKKAAFILSCASALEDLTGELIEYQIDSNWRPGGKILRSATIEQQTWILAVLANDTQTGSEFRLKSTPEIIFTAQALPYNLE
jgi:folate-binding protein YgfZ